MMCFIDDQHTEPVAQPRHVTIGALEGRYGDGLHSAVAIAETTDGSCVHPGYLAAPLVKQHARRHQANCARQAARCSGKRHPRLTAPRWKYYQSAPSGKFPCVKGCFLVRSQLDSVESSRNPSMKGNLVRYPDTTIVQFRYDFSVPVGGRSICTDARIPHHAWQGGNVWVTPIYFEQ